MADAATIGYYEANAPVYTAKFGHAASRHLDDFLDRLGKHTSILELGCGGGRDSARIIERGFILDATDGTPAMVRKANERFDVGARHLLFEDLAAVAAYDAVWAHACLLHAAREDLASILASIHLALKPGGWHFANYKLGAGDGDEGEGRDLLGRLTNLPNPEWLEDSYRAAGFSLEQTERYRGKGADGTMRDWYALTVRKS